MGHVAGAWRAFLIALGVLLAQGAVAFHLLLVPHTTCEHGELVEATVAHAAGSAERGSHDGSDRVGAGDARGDHDHCDALAVRHHVPEVGKAVAASTLSAILTLEACGERGETRPVALLSLAPKGSPPLL